MKILFFEKWLENQWGGTESHIMELASRLAKRGNEVHILTQKGQILRDWSSIKVWRVSNSYGETPYSVLKTSYAIEYMLRAFFKIIFLRLRGIKFDIVSVHFTLESNVMRMIRLLFKWPYVHVLEGYTYNEAKAAKYANTSIAISETIVDLCNSTHGYKPIYIPVGIDRRRFSPDIKKNTDTHEKIVLTVSRLVPEKNVSILIEAAKIVCDKKIDILFKIIGDGREKNKLEKIIENYNLKNKVILVGNVSNEDLPQYYKSADIFVLTQEAEVAVDHFWITVLEALSSGLPIIAISSGKKIEILGDSGIIIPPRNPHLLAEKIIALMTDADLYKELSNKSLERSKVYDYESIFPQYENIYKSLCN